ncbi:hypothetical protein [Nocardia sp. NPDC051981]|uniref:hypothetical protein n=1 Tax=Nocardia sp. NPDC051981 TaxID=3155417 RepID=UPI003416C360
MPDLDLVGRRRAHHVTGSAGAMSDSGVPGCAAVHAGGAARIGRAATALARIDARPR